MKRILVTLGIFVVLYLGIVNLQVFLGKRHSHSTSKPRLKNDMEHKLQAFSFSKFGEGGSKEIEIEGDSANILEEIVFLSNVLAKAYAEEVAITLTADKGRYDKNANEILLQKNVVGTTENGARLLTEELTLFPENRRMNSNVETEVKKDNINIDGTGATGDTHLKKVKFKKNVTVVIQDLDDQTKGPTVITCDGPLIIDYEKNIAHFKKNVVAKDFRGTLRAETMDVYYNRISRHVSKIVALEKVVIENPDGSKTYSDSVIYLAEEGRVILGGDTEALYYEGNKTKQGDLF